MQRSADGRSRLEPSARRRRKHDVDRLGRLDLARGRGLDSTPQMEPLARGRRGVAAACHEVAAGADRADLRLFASAGACAVPSVLACLACPSRASATAFSPAYHGPSGSYRAACTAWPAPMLSIQSLFCAWAKRSAPPIYGLFLLA